MLVSDLIRELQKVQEAHGDVPVAIQVHRDRGASVPDTKIYVRDQHDVEVITYQEHRRSFADICRVDHACILQIIE